MYEFSRQLYRDLQGDLQPPAGISTAEARQRLLTSAEYIFGRLADEPWLARRLCRTLFADVRPLFALAEHPYVLSTIASSIVAARERLVAAASGGSDDPTVVARCRARVRNGSACQRPPGADGLCPSHRHYSDAFRREAALIRAA